MRGDWDPADIITGALCSGELVRLIIFAVPSFLFTFLDALYCALLPHDVNADHNRSRSLNYGAFLCGS